MRCAALDQMVERDVAVGDALVLAELVELDIDADQIAALARDDERCCLRRPT